MEEKVKIGIVGLGLIGGSILKSLSKKGYECYCVSKSSYLEAKKYATISSNDYKTVKNCDVIFVCSNIDKIENDLDELNKILDKNAIVLDVASVKTNLLNKKYNFNFILSHPMAGSHLSGFSASDCNLFQNAKWLIQEDNELIKNIIKDMEAIPVVFDMELHDKSCAQISHLPTILSFLLFMQADDVSKVIASSGFRDTTRLAMTNSNLALNMLNNNLKNIEDAMKKVNENLNYLKNLSDDEKIKLFNALSKKRAEMYDNSGKNIFKI